MIHHQLGQQSQQQPQQNKNSVASGIFSGRRVGSIPSQANRNTASDSRQQQKNSIATAPGNFGTIVAYAAVDEEQGRKAPHRHIQLWVDEVNEELRPSDSRKQ